MATSWVPDMDPASDFSLANIPFGIISTASDPTPRPAVAIGTHVLDLKALASSPSAPLTTLFPDTPDLTSALSQPTLNAFAALGRPLHRRVRAAIQDLLSSTTSHPALLRDDPALRAAALLPQRAVRTHLPLAIGDYTDFYAGYHHAHAVGVLFRGAERALQPNYLHLPVGYHGRASSVVVSGTPVRRPVGQIVLEGEPVTAASRRLDFELELGCFVARGNEMGTAVGVAEAEEEYVFGYVLLNDWSARDVQTWEYVPLGPFNGKNFATTVSPWVVLADALEGFRARGVENGTELQGYLRGGREDGVFDIRLEVDLTSELFLSLLALFFLRDLLMFFFYPSRRGRHDHHQPHQLQEPDLVVPADDCTPHARRLPAAHRRPAGLRHHQRPRGVRRARQPTRDDGERQEGGAACGDGRADLPQGRRHHHAARLLRARGRPGRVWGVPGAHLQRGAAAMMRGNKVPTALRYSRGNTKDNHYLYRVLCSVILCSFLLSVFLMNEESNGCQQRMAPHSGPLRIRGSVGRPQQAAKARITCLTPPKWRWERGVVGGVNRRLQALVELTGRCALLSPRFRFRGGTCHPWT